MDKLEFKRSIALLHAGLQDLAGNLKDFFGHASTQDTARHYLQGLLSSVERKNSWQIAEEEGLSRPYRLQHLLGRALWNADDGVPRAQRRII